MQGRLSLKLQLDDPPANLWQQVQRLTGVTATSDWGLDWGASPVLNLEGELTVMAGTDDAVERGLDLLLQLLADRDGTIETDFGVALVQRDGLMALDEDPEVFWTARLRELVGRRRTFTLAPLNEAEKALPRAYEESFEPRIESFESSILAYDLDQTMSKFNPKDQSVAFVEHFRHRTGLALNPELVVGGRPAILQYLQENTHYVDCWPPLSPALVIGGGPQLTNRLPWLYLMEHQHGGYPLAYRTLSGAVLRLEDHPQISRFVLAGFEAMEEDPDWRTLRKHYPMLEDLTGTYVDAFTPEQLERLHQFIARDVQLPRFESGLEALVECESCDPWDWFAGWRMVGPGDLRYTAEVHAELRGLFGDELRVFFLWGNCD
ncbi:MAG: hypothetical protein J0I12_34955 [Candidatus Eremiobacteraeota bacterium]|nr:hypothetical protein [Candidatus Eremiobacteraeota bacterium]